MLVTVLVFLSSACADDFLEFIPEDQATVDAWYRNREEIRQSTAALYGRPWWGYSDQFSWLAGDLMAGDPKSSHRTRSSHPDRRHGLWKHRTLAPR